MLLSFILVTYLKVRYESQGFSMIRLSHLILIKIFVFSDDFFKVV